MKDRISTYPGRIKLTPVEGVENQYTLEWADEPLQIGTPLSKATFLPDVLANRLKLLQEDPTVADALDAMAATMEKACKITVGEEPPTSSTFGDVGDEYLQVKSDTDIVIWKCVGSADENYEWISFLKTLKEFHTEIFTTSTEFVAQENIVGNAHIICVGGGGASYNGGGAGGGSGYIRQYTGEIPVGKHTVTVGLGGTGGNSGGTSSFGTLVSAPGGGAGGYGKGGSGGAGGGGNGGSGGNGETGGGGGAGFDIVSYKNPSGNTGGNGGTYGGGGGGAATSWSYTEDGSSGYVYGRGGNSAKYSGATPVSDNTDNGTYGHSGGGAGYSASATSNDGGAGMDTTKLGLEFTGTGLAGVGDGRYCGGGGGGYGGNGGAGGDYGGGGGGGGGYGANGGSGQSAAGGGGGGWGSPGRNGAYTLSQNGGGGGGGYGAANYGGGGGPSNKSGGTTTSDPGKDGVVIIEYWTFSAEVIS